MTLTLHIFTFLLSIAFLALVIRYVRRGDLNVQYAMLWLLLAAVMTLFAVVGPSGLNRLAKFAGIDYAPSLLFLVGLLFSLAMILHLSVVLSKLREQVTRLTQEHALLIHELNAKERNRDYM